MASLPATLRQVLPRRQPGAVAGALGVAVLGLLTALAPRLKPDVLAEIGPAVAIHLAAALGALAIGAMLLVGRKGHAAHRALGWAWAVLMGVVAGGSFFIRGLNGDAFSWIHLLSGWTLIVLPIGLAFARRRRVETHRRTMVGLYAGGLLIAGGFTFLPGRLMWRLFFG